MTNNGIAEKLARATAGRHSDFGATPSKEQQRVIDRTQESIQISDADKRKQSRAIAKQENRKPDPAPSRAVCRNTRVTRPGFAREEILAAMRGLDATSVAYVLMEHVQDRSSYPQALHGVVSQAVDLHIANNWRTVDPGKDVIRSMCRLALLEASNLKCHRCKGTKYTQKGKHCRVCRATGKMRIFDTDRAKAIGVTSDCYKKTYRSRYNAVCAIVREIGPAALRKIHKNLYGEKSE
jgi:hypothetical protein